MRTSARTLACLLLAAGAADPRVARAEITGRVVAGDGAPVVGAMVSVQAGDPLHTVTVFSAHDGRFRLEPPALVEPVVLRVRRIGWQDLRLSEPALTALPLELVLTRETDPAAVASQLPANRWLELVLQELEEPAQREEFKRQCAYCHQQGNAATRLSREPEEWRKLLLLMGRMGGLLHRDLREALPAILESAYDPETAVPALTRGMGDADFAPPPPERVRRARVDEWELGERSSMQHDLMVHPSGLVYSVDMTHDRLYRLDPDARDGDRRSWKIPHGDLPLGGALRGLDTAQNPNSYAHVGPHSLQAAPDGAIWITLALGNQLARFDPESERFEIHEVADGYYPHTLRFDGAGRVWFTIAASNHLGMLDPVTGKARQIRLPARSFGQAVALRMMPFFLWLGRHVDLRSLAAEGDGVNVPIPYGIDIAPDGGVWFSQLNEHRIGRLDPFSFEIEMVETPFPAPRRLRFDAEGRLWIPSFSGSKLAVFEPSTRTFREWSLPIEPVGTEVPYALNVDRRPGAGDVWICGTNSDTLIRFEPDTERFTVYPLPTRVTYTREIDFDAQGRVWTSNSNVPAWQIETGVPRVLRLTPETGVDAGGARRSR